MGIIIPLAIALLLIIPQTYKRDLSLMDLASLIYFSIAIVATLILNLNIFVERSGFLGYLALFLMASLSLIVKQLYTLQASKRDYPGIYWKEKSSPTINSVITRVWAAIFAVNAVISLLLKPPFTIILLNTLITLGIIFSVIFPLKAPAYFVTKEFKKFDWSVKVDPQKQKGENEYDVIIVGSGIGG